MPDTLTAESLQFDVLRATGEAREVTGLAVPYGEALHRPNWQAGTTYQKFAPGAAKVRDNAQLFYGHDHLDNRLPIGRITSSEQTDAGLVITAKISATPKGDEVYTLLKDGVITQFSIGFYFLANHVDDVDTDEAVLVHDEVDVFEVSVVPDPAFNTAVIHEVFSERNTMTNPTPTAEAMSADAGRALGDDVATLSQAVDRIEAQVATLGSSASSDTYDVPFSSYGEYVQALARGEEDAQRLFLDYSGGVIADLGDVVKDGWLGDVSRMVDNGRKVMNLFDKGQMPASGMGVEYAFLDEDTTQVTEQEAEGDELAFGKITFDTDRAPIKTYGGWSEMSRQEIERSPIAVLETAFKALALRYAKTTEAVVRGAALSATAKSITADLTDADGWIDFITDASMHFEDKGLAPEFMLVGADVWKDLAKLRDGAATDAPRLLDRRNGSLSITGLSGNLFDLPVVPINTGTTTGVVRVCNSFAVRSFESGGAPLRLQDEDITTLTKAFSVYGYLAAAVIDANAIVAPAAAGTGD